MVVAVQALMHPFFFAGSLNPRFLASRATDEAATVKRSASDGNEDDENTEDPFLSALGKPIAMRRPTNL